MLKSQLLHPQILEALGRAGHSSKVLIADGNFPFSTRLGPRATLVNLNVMPGLLSATQALEALLTAIPVEAAGVMAAAKTGPYAMKSDPPIFAEFAKLLAASGSPAKIEKLERFKFYEQASSPDVCLTIATGEQRIYGNLLLTIGVVMPK